MIEKFKSDSGFNFFNIIGGINVIGGGNTTGGGNVSLGMFSLGVLFFGGK